MKETNEASEPTALLPKLHSKHAAIQTETFTLCNLMARPCVSCRHISGCVLSKINPILVNVLLDTSPVSDCGLPTFRNPLSVPSSKAGCGVSTIWRRGDTQKNIYNIQDKAKVWNQE